MKKVCYLVAFMLVAMLAVSCSDDEGSNGNRDNPNNPNNPENPNNPPAESGWKQLTNFGGSQRNGTVAFAINGKVYAGLGPYNDFWEYDPATNKWTQKASYPGSGNNRQYYGAGGFSIGEKGYVGFLTEFWEYDPAANEWTQKNYHGDRFYFCFSSENKAYVILDHMGSFWEYNPATDQWTQKANAPTVGKGAYMSNKGYLININRCWEYDINTDQWVGKSGLQVHIPNICFVVNNKLYVGSGYNDSSRKNDIIYEFDVEGNKWNNKTSFPFDATSSANIVAVIQNKAYIGLGGGVDFWQYIP